MSLKLGVVFLILVILGGFLQFSYDSKIDYFAEHDTFLSLPSAKTLKILSFGNSHFVADVLFIWAIQFYSSLHINNRFDYIEHIFNIITDLNPKLQAAYYYGAIIMALEAREFEMAIKLLQKGSKNMTHEWIFDYESAYYAYKFLKNYELAESFYLKASQNPDAPPLIKRRRAHMVYIRDDLDLAYQLWKEIENSAKTQVEKDAAFHHLYQIKFEMDIKLFDSKIETYKERYGRFPFHLGELTRVGLIDSLPKDYVGDDYLYNNKTGKIRAKRTYRWKKLF
jgi:tetratricopeptide (TPR) repeat protein